ncbi:hypothetical protein ElyMa_004609000 [Elysia marginata]|uniref:Uncharacterized protein n=1 Tax=Elysia marginata TaxID=1093978 RepID=A0AAV4I087_9GAST|nr:hypothetical protein ElyMa_004609000 [Elysia marginata]
MAAAAGDNNGVLNNNAVLTCGGAGNFNDSVKPDGEKRHAEKEDQGDKYLKSLELAMVELRPLPKPACEETIKQEENTDSSTIIEQTPATGKVSEIDISKEEQTTVSSADPKIVTTEVNSSQNYSTVSIESLVTEPLDSSLAVSCQPETPVSESLSPPNTDIGSKPAGTIASVTATEKEPIDYPRSTDSVKLDKRQGINTATVTTSPNALSIPHNSCHTNTEKLYAQPIISKSNIDADECHTNTDKKVLPNRGKSPSRGSNIASVLLPNVDLEKAKVNSNGHPAIQLATRSQPSTRDKCLPGQRVLNNTGHLSGGNYYQNSRKPTMACARHKCFFPNTVSTRECSQSNTVLPNYERPYGKRELRRALPRKSNFSCHDAAMKEAGFEDESIALRKAERLKERLARVANSFNPLLGLSNYVATGCEPAGIEVVVTDENSNTKKQRDADVKDIEAVAAGNVSTNHLAPDTDTSFQNGLISAESSTLEVKDDSSPSRHLLGGVETAVGSRRRRPGSARIEYVECKPLSQYLEYIRDNRQEYISYIRHQQHQHQVSRKDKAVATLIKMGQAFELRHQGGTTRDRKSTKMIADGHDSHVIEDGESGADVIVMAAKALRPRTANPGKYARSRDKSGGGGGRRGTEPPARPLSEDRKSFHADKNTHGSSTPTATGGAASHGAKEEEHPKTELERRKLKAEDWTRSVPTHTLTRARIQSLRELGTDDPELTKWWEAFKGCHYLRQNICHT